MNAYEPQDQTIRCLAYKQGCGRGYAVESIKRRNTTIGKPTFKQKSIKKGKQDCPKVLQTK